MGQLWERQPRESYEAFSAFQEFLTRRSYPKVAEAVGKSLTLIKRWGKKFHWYDRADAWDSELSRQTLEKASEDCAKMLERQVNIGRMFQSKAANAIQAMDFTNLPPKFLNQLVNLAKAKP